MPVLYSYTDTVTPKRGIADVIHNLDFKTAPLLKLFGFGNENIKKFQILNWPSTKVEWLQDTNVIFATTTAESLDGSATELDVAANMGQFFRTGDIVGILPGTQDYGEPAEKLRITSVATDTLTFDARGYGSTSATTHSSGATIVILTRAMGENAIYTLEGSTIPTAPYNYTQIIDGFVEISDTEASMMRYGITDQMNYRLSKLMDNNGQEGRLPKMLHKTFYTGERIQRTTATGEGVGAMGGFNTFVTTVTASSDHVLDLNGAALEKEHVHQVLRAIRDSGDAEAPYLITSSWGIEKICAMYEDNRYTTTDTKIVGSPQVETVRTPHGEVKLVFDHMCDKSEYYFVNPKYIGWLPMRQFFRKKVYGDSINSPYDGAIEGIVGEYTFVMANPTSHGRIYDASVTS